MRPVIVYVTVHFSTISYVCTCIWYLLFVNHFLPVVFFFEHRQFVSCTSQFLVSSSVLFEFRFELFLSFFFGSFWTGFLSSLGHFELALFGFAAAVVGATSLAVITTHFYAGKFDCCFIMIWLFALDTSAAYCRPLPTTLFGWGDLRRWLWWWRCFALWHRQRLRSDCIRRWRAASSHWCRCRDRGAPRATPSFPSPGGGGLFMRRYHCRPLPLPSFLSSTRSRRHLLWVTLSASTAATTASR